MKTGGFDPLEERTRSAVVVFCFIVIVIVDIFTAKPRPLRPLEVQLTLHLVVEGELLAGPNGPGGEQGDPGEPLVDVVDEDVEDLKVGVALEENNVGGSQAGVTRREREVPTNTRLAQRCCFRSLKAFDPVLIEY